MKTIKSPSEITRLFEEGRRVRTPELSLIALRNESQHDRQGRVAFIAGKKLGNAVWRNRAKRRMRAACRDLGGAIEGYDVVFLARAGIDKAPYQGLLRHVGHAFDKVKAGEKR